MVSAERNQSVDNYEVQNLPHCASVELKTCPKQLNRKMHSLGRKDPDVLHDESWGSHDSEQIRKKQQAQPDQANDTLHVFMDVPTHLMTLGFQRLKKLT